LQKCIVKEEKIKRAHENPWLVNLRKKMAEHGKRTEELENYEEQAVMKSLLEINSNNLRLYYKGQRQ